MRNRKRPTTVAKNPFHALSEAFVGSKSSYAPTSERPDAVRLHVNAIGFRVKVTAIGAHAISFTVIVITFGVNGIPLACIAIIFAGNAGSLGVIAPIFQAFGAFLAVIVTCFNQIAASIGAIAGSTNEKTSFVCRKFSLRTSQDAKESRTGPLNN